MIRTCMRAGLCSVLLMLLAACASTSAVFEYQLSNTGYRWPAPPEVPRFELLGQLTGEGNFPHEAQGFGGRVMGWLLGLDSDKRIPRVLQRPQSGFVDESTGRIYVTDVSRGAVFVFDEAGAQLRIWQSAGQVARLVSPMGITSGANGEILVADADLGIVVRLSAEGEPLGGIGLGKLVRPVGIARDPVRGRIFVADSQAHDVKVFADDGSLLETIGRRGEGKGEFNGPTYLAWAGDRLLVTDTLNSRVQIFDADGRYLRDFGRRGLFVGDMPRPKGVAADTRGNLYVVESYYDHLLVFNGDGELLLPIGGSGSGIGQFYLPAGVWTDHRDRIYVADSFNGRVMIFQLLGET